jgi:hypothetical protein
MRPLDDVQLATLDVHRLRSMFPDMEGQDPDMWKSLVESETTIPETAARLYDEVCDDRAMASAVRAQIADMEARAERFDRRAKTRMNIIHRLLRETNQTSLELPRITLFTRAGGKSVDVYDPSALPDDFMRHKPAPPPEPDKPKIAEALRDGKTVPGARWQYGQETLQERKT